MGRKRIAILGAGMLGSCLALEMAKRGLLVDLYDRESKCLTQAGMRNEGKIHLGFVYGADPSERTAPLMLSGALQFSSLVRRWIGDDLASIAVSSPFLYAVAKEGILSQQAFEAHGEAINRKLSLAKEFDYLGKPHLSFEKLAPSIWERWFSPRKIGAVYQTAERALDVRKVAEALREKVMCTPEITFFPNSVITEVMEKKNGWLLGIVGESVEKEYDIVVNTLWDGRRAIDATAGIKEVHSWCYRMKQAIFLKCNEEEELPSATIVQGPYGDLVNFGEGRYYLSWYPTCMQGFVKNGVIPSQWNRNLGEDEAIRLTNEAIAGLAEYIPPVANILKEHVQELSVLGGIIDAQGVSDVDDPKSGLHTRYEMAIKKKNTYFSINPGKYSLCPSFAYKAADAICSEMALSVAHP